MTEQGCNAPRRATARHRKWWVGALLAAVAVLHACDGGPIDPPPATDMVGPQGGTVRSSDGAATLLVPPASLSAPVRITVETVLSPPAGAAGPVYRIGPSGTRFNPEARLTLQAGSGSLENLVVATHESGAWVPLPTTADPGSRTLTAPVSHLSLFALVDPDGDAAAICQELRITTSSVRPGRRLELRGVGPRLLAGDLLARVEIQGVGDPLPVFIEPVDADVASVIAPLHPVGRLAGGEATLVVSSAEVQCPGLPFVIESLPSASGTLEAAVNLLDSAFTAFGEQLGFDRSALLETPLEDLPAGVVAVAGGLRALDGPGFENSMRAILRGTAPALEGVAPDLEILDAVLASLELVENLETITEGLLGPLAGAGAWEAGSRPSPGASHGPGGPALRGLQPVQPPAVPDALIAPSSGPVCRGDRFTTPAFLDRAMNVHWEAMRLRSGAARAVNEGVGAGLATVGLLGGPPAAAAAGTAGLLLALVNISLDMQAGEFPSELEAIQLVAEGRTFLGDADPANATGQGRWEAEVAAWSTGYELDLPTVLSAVPGLGTKATVLTRLAGRTPAVNAVTAKTLDFVQSLTSSIWGAYETNGVVLIDPCRYGPVQVDPARSGERDYFDWRLLGPDGAFGFADEPTEYRVQAKGRSELRVETNPQQFLGQHRIAQADLEVLEIAVQVLAAGGGSSPYILEPGESIDLVAQVDNAHDGNVIWSAPTGGTIPPGQWNPSLVPVGSTFTAPMEPGRYRVEAESASRRGLRAPGEPPRIGYVHVVVGGLRITPRPACVRVGETVRFSATLAGDPVPFSDLEVVVTNGTITADGVFTPAGEGEVTLDVRSRDQPSLTDTLTFTVATYCAEWTMSISGDRSFQGGGQCVEAFGDDPEPGSFPTLSSLGIDDVVGFGIAPPFGTGSVSLGAPGVPVTLTGSYSSLLFLNDEVWFPTGGPGVPSLALTVTWVPVDGPDGDTWAELSGSFGDSFIRIVGPDEIEHVSVSGTFSGVLLNLGYDLSCN